MVKKIHKLIETAGFKIDLIVLKPVKKSKTREKRSSGRYNAF